MCKGPRTSVIIPAFNGVKYIGRAIDSVLVQGMDVELIIVDDQSSDRTVDIVRSYPEARLIRMVDRGGDAYRTANVGLAAAQGDYVAVLHQDDVWKPGKLAKSIAQLESDSKIGLCYSALDFIGPDENRLATLRSPCGRGDAVREGLDELRYLGIQNYINSCNAVVRRAALSEVGPFPESLWFTGEWAVWTRLARSWRIAYIDEPLCCFRVHPASQSQSRTNDGAELRRQLMTVIDDLFDDPGVAAQLGSRRRLAYANTELTITLLSLYWRDGAGALRAAVRLIRRLRVTEISDLVRSSCVIPRTAARLRAARTPAG